jgi:hypothetical protein
VYHGGNNKNIDFTKMVTFYLIQVINHQLSTILQKNMVVGVATMMEKLQNYPQVPLLKQSSMLSIFKTNFIGMIKILGGMKIIHHIGEMGLLDRLI